MCVFSSFKSTKITGPATDTTTRSFLNCNDSLCQLTMVSCLVFYVYLH